MTNPANPFNQPKPEWPWPSTAVTTAAAASWPAPAAPKIDNTPPNAAIDRTTGEVFMRRFDERGEPCNSPWDRDALLLHWQSTQAALEAAKAEERKYRDMVVACYTSPDKIKGTENVELGNGYMLKTVKAINYKVGSKVEGVSNIAAVQAALARIKGFVSDDVPQGVGALIAERIVKTSFELSVGEYGKLPEPLRAIIDDVITTSPGAPQVEIIAPKEPKQ